MHEDLLAPLTSVSSDEPSEQPANTRQKKSLSAPEMIIPDSLAQLEHAVSCSHCLASQRMLY